MIGKLANSPAAAPDIDTSTEDTARLGYEAGRSAFQINYTFAFGSAGENAPDIQKNTGIARYPAVTRESRAARRWAGSTSASASSPRSRTLAFEAAKCIALPRAS